MESNEKLMKLLLQWEERILFIRKCHYLEADRHSLWNKRLGTPTVILSAIVTAAVFSSSSNGLLQFIGENTRIFIVGTISLLATILSALYAFFKFEEKADRYRRYAGDYAILLRKIEVIKVSPSELDSKVLLDIKEKMDELTRNAPKISEKVLTSGKDVYKNRENTIGGDDKPSKPSVLWVEHGDKEKKKFMEVID